MVFGRVFERLSRLEVGETIDMSDCGPLRREIPRVLPYLPTQGPSYRFRSVQIRRGAVFPEIPASSTARRFSDMVEETLPWMLILVPE